METYREDASAQAKAFDELVRCLGGTNATSELLGIKPSTLKKMRKGSSYIAPGITDEILDAARLRLQDLAKAIAEYSIVEKYWPFEPRERTNAE